MHAALLRPPDDPNPPLPALYHTLFVWSSLSWQTSKHNLIHVYRDEVFLLATCTEDVNTLGVRIMAWRRNARAQSCM